MTEQAERFTVNPNEYGALDKNEINDALAVFDYEIAQTKSFGHEIKPQDAAKEVKVVLGFLNKQGGFQELKKHLNQGEYGDLYQKLLEKVGDDMESEPKHYFDQTTDFSSARTWYAVHLSNIASSTLRMIEFGKEAVTGK